MGSFIPARQVVGAGNIPLRLVHLLRYKHDHARRSVSAARMPLPKVIINSLPKSGTHLVAKLLDLAGMKDCRVVFDRQVLIGRSWLEKNVKNLSRTDGREIVMGIDMPLAVPTRFVEEKFAAVKAGEYVKAHTGYTTAVIRLAQRFEMKPVVVVRDPRDVIISFVHFVLENRKHPLFKTLNAFKEREKCIDAAIDGGFFDGIYLENIRARCHSLDPWLDTPGIPVVRFEDLIGSKGKGSDAVQHSSIKRILDYIGLEKSDAELDEIAANLHGPGRVTFRKGVIGESKKEMSPTQLQRADAVLGDIYERWGYQART
jgi:hypothetical protein